MKGDKHIPQAYRDHSDAWIQCKRGIRWIDPQGVRRNFEFEQAKKERAFAAGFVAGQKGGSLSDALVAYCNSSLETHCSGLGFTADELRSLEQ